jgi:hypothetical protein
MLAMEKKAADVDKLENELGKEKHKSAVLEGISQRYQR